MRPSRLVPVLFVCSLLVSCVIVRHKGLEEIAPRPRSVESPLRVFLADGSVVVFPHGAVVGPSEVTGSGARYDLTRTAVGNQSRVSMDSVIGIEAFNERTDPGLTLLASIGVTTVAVGGAVALACAADPKCFGSCPTVYSYDADGERLEAEAFSFSISPLLEGRDIDALAVQADSEGVVELEVRNEALETHFINQLELLEARHARGEQVLTDPTNVPVLVGPLRAIGPVTDRDGRDVTATVANRDGQAFVSSVSRISAARAGDDRDWLEMTLPPMAADSAAVVLRLRDSLLSTILFYEFMLGHQGAGALDWMAHDVQRIGNAVELGRWFYRTMGLRLEVEHDGRVEEVARLGDTGPIAWKEVAFPVPVKPNEPTRLRLSFLADEWRIDQIAWSPRVARPSVRTIAAESMTPVSGGTGKGKLGSITEADDDYLVTSAGTAFTVRFDAGAAPGGMGRTFLLSSQGYYTEWVRPSWVRTARHPTPFRPTDDLIPHLMRRWLEVRGPMEAAFHETKIPVR